MVSRSCAILASSLSKRRGSTINKPRGYFHIQLEGLATDLGLVVVKVLCDTDEVNTNTLLAITSKVPRGRQVVREVDA